MLVKTDLIPKGFDAFTCWPFIFIRPKYISNEGLIKHEMVHYKEQGLLSIPWLIQYFLSKKFRLAAEVRAYKVQIACDGITLMGAAVLLTTYRLGISLEEAMNALMEED